MKTRRIVYYVFLAVVVMGASVVLIPHSALAWPTAPVINSDIGTDEYGTGNAYNYSSGTPKWYMTWDDTYVYISIQDANETQAGIVYFDLSPIEPVNGGSTGNGSLTGLPSYDGLTPDLPFRADAAIYFKNDYRELRRWNGSSAWTSISSGNGGLSGANDDYSDNSYSSNNHGSANSDDDRELRISWCRLTGGSSNCLPGSFNWTGYIAYTNGIYGQVPIENPSGTLTSGSTPDFIRYFTVSVTTDGSQTNPMSRNSYTHVGDDISSFAAIGVWDFTMNTTGKSITRSSGDWTISGSFRVDSGTVSFGSTSSNTTIGNVIVGSGGTLNLATATGTFSVSGSVTNNGTIQQTKTVGTSANVNFGMIDTKYYGVNIVTDSSHNLGSTTVSVKGNQICAQAQGYPVKRCFDVTPTTQQSANIRFYYSQAEMQGGAYDTLNVWNYHSSQWNSVTRGGDSGSCATNAINCYVQGNSIANYSPFALKVTSPQAITLADFSAAQTGDAVLLTWETNSELDNRGFNLYRGLSPGAPDRQLNETLIPSQGPGSPGGFIYTWEDHADLVSGTTYFYWVEDVDMNGVATRHGPVSVDYNAPTALRLLDAGAATTLPLALPLMGAGLLALAAAVAWRKRRLS